MTHSLRKPDGGPAFPMINPNYDGNWNKEPVVQGMSLRDYFAGQALLRLEFDETTPHSRQAAEAYRMADAMITARGQ